MTKYILSSLIIVLLFTNRVYAACNTTFVNPLTEVSWECMFPIRLANMNTSPSGPDPQAPMTQPLCSCKDGTWERVGVTAGFREPSYLIDVVKDSFCFAGLGVDLGNGNSMGDGSSSAGGAKSTRSEYTAQTHIIGYNPLFMLELLMDMKCLTKMPISIIDMSELRPDHNDELLNAMVYPEALLFANPVAQTACIADSVSANAGFPLDSLFWCNGSWGTVYPLSGRSVNSKGSRVEASANVASKVVARAHRNLTMWGTKGPPAMCGEYPLPVWMKSQYKLQAVRPVKSTTCPVVGRSGLLWGAGNNPPVPGKSDNFSYILWRYRDCCVF